MSRSFTVGDREYEVSTEYFHPGSHGGYWDPPDPPEWCPQSIVHVTIGLDGHEDVVTWETFVREYADHRGLALDAAERAVEELMIEHETEELVDMYDRD